MSLVTNQWGPSSPSTSKGSSFSKGYSTSKSFIASPKSLVYGICTTTLFIFSSTTLSSSSYISTSASYYFSMSSRLFPQKNIFILRGKLIISPNYPNPHYTQLILNGVPQDIYIPSHNFFSFITMSKSNGNL